MLHTTLKLLRRFGACGQITPGGSYNKLRASLPADLTDDAPISLLHVLESSGIEDAIWALRATVEPTGKDMAAEMAVRAAERVQCIFDKRFPNDGRARECNEATRAYGRGEITLEVLREKRSAAAAAATTTAAAAADAYAYAAAAADADAYAYAAAAAAYAYAYAAAAAARKGERKAQAADYRELLAQF